MPAGSANSLALPQPNKAAIVVAFRGSDDVAAALTDVQGFTPVPHTFRGQAVEVHRGIAASMLKPAPGASCQPSAAGPQPSCAEAVKGAIDDAISTHKLATPVQVLITGHSLVSAAGARGSRDEARHPCVVTGLERGSVRLGLPGGPGGILERAGRSRSRRRRAPARPGPV